MALLTGLLHLEKKKFIAQRFVLSDQSVHFFAVLLSFVVDSLLFFSYFAIVFVLQPLPSLIELLLNFVVISVV